VRAQKKVRFAPLQPHKFRQQFGEDGIKTGIEDLAGGQRYKKGCGCTRGSDDGKRGQTKI